MSVDRFILTGPPGAGKTTILRSLADGGLRTVDEAATDVVVDWQQKGIAEPWTDPSFVDAVVMTQKERQVRLAGRGGIQFYDRSPICTLALAQWLELPVSEVLQLEIARMLREGIYRREVFFLRNLGFITATEVRRISLAESIRFGELHEELYVEHGFKLIYVEPGSVEERVESMRSWVAGENRVSPLAL